MSRLARRLDFHSSNHNAAGLSSDGLSSSTLRARLSSQGPSAAVPAALSSSPNPHLQLNDLYQHFRACFAAADSTSANPQLSGRNGAIGISNSSNGGNALEQLGESFAQAGSKLHASVVDQLSQAQGDIVSKIDRFSQLSSSLLSDLDDLYSNLAYPLSATICHSANFPRATIATHLSNVREQLRLADEELRDLSDEWDENIRLEDGLRKELASMGKESAQQQQQSRRRAQPSADHGTERFKDEAERIAEDKIQALNDIEMQYKEWLQAETMEMMQFILAD